MGEGAHESAEEDEYELRANRSSNKSKPYSTKLDVDWKPLKMEVDTGASLTLVLEHRFHSHWPDTSLAESRIKLSSYGGESIGQSPDLLLPLQWWFHFPQLVPTP